MDNQAAKSALYAIKNVETYLNKWKGIEQKAEVGHGIAAKIVRNTKNEPESMRDVPTSRLLRYKNCLEAAIESMQINVPALQRSNGVWSLVPSPDLLNLLGSWQESPMVLQYDDVLADILLTEPLDEDLIVDNLLIHLPFNSFFVQAEGVEFYSYRKSEYYKADGFFVSEAWIPSKNRPWNFEKWLSIVCVVDGLLLPIMIPTKYETYGEVLKSIEEEAKSLFFDDKDAVQVQVKEAQSVLNLILYLGAKDAEVDKVAERLLKTGKLQEAPARHKPGQDKIPFLTTYVVGKGVGEVIRKDDNNTASADERKMAAHIRRAHYHTYLEGSRKDGTLHPVVHWVEAVPVNMRKGSKDQDPIVRRVK